MDDTLINKLYNLNYYFTSICTFSYIYIYIVNEDKSNFKAKLFELFPFFNVLIVSGQRYHISMFRTILTRHWTFSTM